MTQDYSLDGSDWAARRRSSGRFLIVVLLAAVALGAGLALWAGSQFGWIEIAPGGAVRPLAPAPLPQPSVAPSTAGLVSAQTALGVRLAELEQRMTKLNLQADAASGDAARAEGLLIATASRRTIERGEQLGYLSGELKTRFGNAQPNAVQTLLEVSANPVTLDALSQGLENLATTLVAAPRNEGLVARVRGELSNLFVLRKAAAPSPAPERRLERARLFLETGRPEAAIAEVERMPGHAAARDWIALAQRYVRAQRALDLIETAAIVEPPQPPLAAGAPKPLTN